MCFAARNYQIDISTFMGIPNGHHLFFLQIVILDNTLATALGFDLRIMVYGICATDRGV